MMKSYSYIVARVMMPADMQLRAAARKALAEAGLLTRKTFAQTQRGKTQADAYAAKMDAVLNPIGLKAVVVEGFSMTAPE